MDDFPIGIDFGGYGFEELEEELEDMLENDASIYDDNDLGTQTSEMAIRITVPAIVSSALFLVSAGSMSFLSVGLFRHIYVAKSIALFVSSMISITFLLSAEPNDKDGRSPLSSEATTGRQRINYGVAKRMRGQGFQFAIKTFGSLDEVLTFFVFYELYMCTCQMEARMQCILPFAKKTMLAFIVIIFLHGPEILCAFILDVWWDIFMVILDPAALLINLSCTGTVIYLGVQILLALRKSEDFRKANSQSDQTTKKTNHLTLFVLIVAAGQALKFFSRLACLIFIPIYLNKMNDCNKNFDHSFSQEKRCNGYMKQMSYMLSYSKIRWSTILEILFVVALMVCKNCTSKVHAVRKFFAACTGGDGDSLD